MALKDDIILELGDNFTTGDENIIETIITRVTKVALLSANRRGTEADLELLEPEIFECVKSVYLLRGAEDVTARNAQGDDSTYKDAYSALYKQIINHNKRLIL